MPESTGLPSMRPRPGRAHDEPLDDARRIIVKFKDGAELPGELGMPGAPGFRFRRLFTVASDEELNELVTLAKKRDPELPDFRKFFIVDAPADVGTPIAVARLREMQGVELAYLDALSEEPIVDPNDDDPVAGWVQNQGYLDAAPEGIDAEFAWPRANGSGLPGGDGAGVRVIDLERGWNVAHPDLAAHNIQLLHGAIKPGAAGHGNATLGVLCARDNQVGCVGVAPWLAEVGVVSSWGSTRQDALMAAIVNLGDGDLLIIESQVTEITVGGVVWSAMPIEVLDTEFWLIRLATALGITVIEAAGNSHEKLDDFVDPAGNSIFNRVGPTHGFRDSGAIMVSAATSLAPHEPIIFEGGRIHHHGSRIDCYAWGENVTTLTDVDYAMNGFANTSAATAIICGAAAVVQGVAKANNQLLSPGQLRLILSDENNGTTSKNGAAVDGLGVMPDLRKVLLTNDVLSIMPDVYLRDFMGDNGTPHVGAISASPDVLVTAQPSADPQADFGAAGVLFDSQAEAGQTNYVYVRALNTGTADATNVTATVYWSEVATLITPEQWNLVGRVNIPLVPAGNVPIVSPPISWAANQIPSTGHYCFVATLDHPKDPLLDPTGLASPGPGWGVDWTTFQRLIRDNNNITWRNFNVVDNVPDVAASYVGEWMDYVILPFIATGAPDQARRMRLGFVDRLPEGSRVFLDAPLSMREWAAAGSDDQEWQPTGEHRVRVRLKTGESLFGDFVFPARARLKMNLVVRIPPEYRQDSYDLHVSQFVGDTEVGRVTWILVPKPDPVQMAQNRSRRVTLIASERVSAYPASRA